MKKYIVLLSIFIVITLTLIFSPKKVEQCIVLDYNDKYSTVYMDGSIKKIKYTLPYPKLTVLSFKYNSFKAYDFRINKPITDRIMAKQSTSYDLEALGKVPLSKKVFYYKIDKNNNISLVKDTELIIGKNNVKAFKDSTGKLNTFFIYPYDYSSMRVAISTNGFSSIYHDKIQLKSASSLTLYCLREHSSIDIPKNTLINIEGSEKELKVSINNTTKTFNNRVYLKGSNISIINIKRGSPPFIPAYNGVVEFNASSKGMTVINETSIEDYLCKVVPSEMPISGGLEALKCQAVAARTYAISDMLGNRFASLGFYVDDSTKSQVYNNTPVQTLSNTAVNSTKGLVMTYKNKPIDAKYYSTSCGLGAAYSDIWFRSDGSSEDKPYLATNNYLSSGSFPKTEEEWLSFYKNTKLPSIDNVSSYFRWHVDLSSAALTRSLNKSLKNIFENKKGYLTIKKEDKVVNELPELTSLRDVKVLKRSSGGNIIEISFIFDNVTVNLREDSNIRSAIRCSSEYTNEAVAVIRYKDKPLSNNAFLPSSFFSIDKNGDKFTIYGGGYGHGVGMSQYGAMSLAKDGKTYVDILNNYYKGVTIEKFIQ